MARNPESSKAQSGMSALVEEIDQDDTGFDFVFNMLSTTTRVEGKDEHNQTVKQGTRASTINTITPGSLTCILDTGAAHHCMNGNARSLFNYQTKV